MCMYLVFFFKQKTAYEMRISDWSSDVCSSDLTGIVRAAGAANFLLARPWEEDDINPFTEAAAKRDAGEAVARSASLDDALRLCREQDNWRAAFEIGRAHV